MKSTRELFKNNLLLLEEPEVIQLLDYCTDLEEEIIAFKFQQAGNKELAMLDMLQEVVKGCREMEKEQMEHERFGFDPPKYQDSVSNLKKYILDRCREEKIRL